jgi:hypothetical protein
MLQCSLCGHLDIYLTFDSNFLLRSRDSHQARSQPTETVSEDRRGHALQIPATAQHSYVHSTPCPCLCTYVVYHTITPTKWAPAPTPPPLPNPPGAKHTTTHRQRRPSTRATLPIPTTSANSCCRDRAWRGRVSATPALIFLPSTSCLSSYPPPPEPCARRCACERRRDL